MTGRDTQRALGKLATTTHVIVAVAKADMPDGTNITLEPLSPARFREVLEGAGLGEDEAARLARESGKSITVLHRRLTVLEKLPSWARDPSFTALLVPFALAGSWCDSREKDRDGDRIALAALAGRTSEVVERDFLALSSMDDPPVYAIGDVRSVTSRIDAFEAARTQIASDDLHRFLVIAENVLSEPDPTVGLEEGDRWMAAARGVRRIHSRRLRESLAETLILLSFQGDWLHRSLGFDAPGQLARLVRQLLTGGADRWFILRDVFRRLAEASPGMFLDSVEADLESDDPAIGTIMRPVGSGFGAENLRTEMLWALEILAWKPDRFPRVARVLARLSRFRLEDNWVNKPERSLFSLFRAWMPQTAAPIDRRIATLQDLARREPQSTWPLVVNIFGERSGSASPNARPLWRDDAVSAGQLATSDEQFRMRRAALDIALAWPEKTAEQLADLAWQLDIMPCVDQERVCSAIKDWSETADDACRAKLREHVRVHGLTRRGGGHASESLLSRTREIYDRLAPADPITRHGWLFAKHHVDYSSEDAWDEKLDWQARGERIEAARLSAIREIWSSGGLEAIGALAQASEAALAIGRCLSKVTAILRSCDEVVVGLLVGNGFQRRAADEILSGLLAGLPEADKADLFDRLFMRPDVAHDRLLARLNPDENLRPLLERLNVSNREEFWRNVPPRLMIQDRTVMNWFARGLAAADRPRAAFWVVHMDLQHVEQDFLVELLRRMVRQGEDAEQARLPDRYDIVRAFEVLDAKGGLSDDVLANLEFPYLPAFEHSSRRALALERQMSERPELFVEVLAMAYTRDDDGNDPEAWEAPDDSTKQVRAHLAHQLLRTLGRLPGQQSDGRIEIVVFTEWVTTARALCRDYGRAAVGDQKIGELLARSPLGGDGLWPAEPVREILEQARTGDIKTGIELGIFNNRGVTTRGIYDGGTQERDLATQYRTRATQLGARWPATCALLNRLADQYDAQATRADQEAELRKRTD